MNNNALVLLLLLSFKAAQNSGGGGTGPAGPSGAPGAAGPPGPALAPGPRDVGTTDATDVNLQVNGTTQMRLIGAGGVELQAALSVNADNTLDIGAPAARVANIYAANVVTGDLHFRNDTKGVHWILIEEVDGLRLHNVITGNSYMLLMERATL